jgi:hypothetical protein
MMHPHAMVVAGAASAHVGAPPHHDGDKDATAVDIQVRHEERLEGMALRRERALERREMRLARRHDLNRARHHIHLAGVRQHGVEAPSSIDPPTKVAPTRRSSSAQAPGTTSGSSGSSGSFNPTSPLPPNVDQQLATVYEEYLNGTLPTASNQPGQPVIQGTSVEVQIHTSVPGDFNLMVSDAETLGLQVTLVDAAYDTVVGFLPIAALPAAAQLPDTPSITAVDYPMFS